MLHRVRSEKVPKLIDLVPSKMRLLHYAKRTEEAYVHWIVDFLQFARQRAGQWVHLERLGDQDVEAYLTHLAADRRASDGTQNQALSALLFLCTKLLNRSFQVDAVRARRSQRLPVELAHGEIPALFQHLPDGPVSLICRLMYGSGLRLMEACRLRVKDVAFIRKQIVLREGKGNKDRYVPLPDSRAPHVQDQLEIVRRLHHQDLQSGAGWVWLPYALSVKFPEAGRQFPWQYLFPARNTSCDTHPREAKNATAADLAVTKADREQIRRHHIHETTLQQQLSRVVHAVYVVRWIHCDPG